MTVTHQCIGGRKKLKYSEKNCLNADLSATQLTFTGLGKHPVVRAENSVANCSSHVKTLTEFSVEFPYWYFKRFNSYLGTTDSHIF